MIEYSNYYEENWIEKYMQAHNAKAQNASKQAKTRELVLELYGIVNQLEELYEGRKFTLDGHLIGSLGEAYAEENYDITLHQPSAQLHDGYTSDGREVQIKATQGSRVSLSAEGAPDYLLVLSLDKEGIFAEVYNGPGEEPFNNAGKTQKTGQRQIGLSKLRELNEGVNDLERIPSRSF
jgi:hypothetical protein